MKSANPKLSLFKFIIVALTMTASGKFQLQVEDARKEVQNIKIRQMAAFNHSADLNVLNTTKAYRSHTVDDFDLSTFVKESIELTKSAIGIDDMKDNLAKRYSKIVE